MIGMANAGGNLIGCSDIWSNVVLGVAVRVFLDEVNI